MAPGAAGARRPSVVARGLCLALSLLGVVACGDTSADALVVWIDGEIDQNGNRGLQIYDGGERRTIPFHPIIPGSGTELLQLAIDSRGRGIVASGTRETVYVDLRQGRRGRLSETLDPTRDLDRDFVMLRGGDALVRELHGRTSSLARSLGFMALTTRYGLVPTVLQTPDEPEPGARWNFVTATDAPMFFWVEERGSPTAASGRVQAVAYPSAHAPLTSVQAPTVVANGTLQGRGVDDNNAPPGRVNDGICPNRVCVSPSGRVLTTMAQERCAVWRWTWTDALSPDTPLAAERVALPGGCPEALDPFLVATLDDDLVVMDDSDRLLLFDLKAGTMRSAPKLGEGRGRVVLLTGRGSVLLWVTFSGQVVRVDAFGARLVSTERSFCTVVDGVQVSPSGNWVVMSCNGQTPVEGAAVGLVLRVSALGLEQFSGISMRPVTIDDDGNALLYSFDPDDSEAPPRGLFVLGGDGTLARVDDLEPGPAAVAVPDGASGRQTGVFFDATAMPR